MAFRNPHSSFNKILMMAFGVAFGVAALAMAYQAVQNSTERRSKAAEETKEYKKWDFSQTVEGWSSTTLAGLSVSNGILHATIGSSRGGFFNPTVKVSLPTGNKYIAFRMAVVPKNTTRVLGDQTDCTVNPDGTSSCEGFSSTTQVPVGGTVPGGYGVSGEGTASRPTPPCVPEPTCTAGQPCPKYYPQGGWCPPTPTSKPGEPCVPKPICAEGNTCAEPQYYPQGGWCPPTPSQTPKPFVFSVLYWLEKDDLTKPPKAAPMEFKGIADGAMKEYTVRFAEVGNLRVKQVRFRFDSGVVAGDQVLFDWIRILGPMIKPTPTPTLSCRPIPICQAGKPCPKYYPQDGWCKPTPTPTLSCRPVPPCPAGKPCPMYYPRDGWCSTPPTTPPTSTGYTCPASGWVDCMPIMDNAKRKACSAEAMTWYKANCPNFKGGAF